MVPCWSRVDGVGAPPRVRPGAASARGGARGAQRGRWSAALRVGPAWGFAFGLTHPEFQIADGQNRDLRPTIDLRAVLKGLLKDHLRLADRPLSGEVFPDSGDVVPMEGLLA